MDKMATVSSQKKKVVQKKGFLATQNIRISRTKLMKTALVMDSKYSSAEFGNAARATSSPNNE